MYLKIALWFLIVDQTNTHRFNAINDTLFYVYFSDTHFDTAMRRLWPRYMLYPLEKEDGSHCSMVDVFGQRKSASNVYIRHWNEV